MSTHSQTTCVGQGLYALVSVFVRPSAVVPVLTLSFMFFDIFTFGIEPKVCEVYADTDARPGGILGNL